MDVYGGLRKYMRVYGSLWGLWESMDKYEYLRVSTGIYGSLWGFIGLYG